MSRIGQRAAVATHWLLCYVFTFSRLLPLTKGVTFSGILPTEKTELFPIAVSGDILHKHPAHQGVGSFQIGTDQRTANVVSDFEVVPAWAAGTDLGAFVDVDEGSSSFWLTATEPLILTNAYLELDNTFHANPVLHGPVAESLQRHAHFSFIIGTPFELDVLYQCLSHGDIHITLVLEFEDLSPLRVPWFKTCGGFLNQAFRVTAGHSHDEVVSRGEPRWDIYKILSGDQSFTNFTLSLDPFGKLSSQEISAPSVKGQGSCSAYISTSSELDSQRGLIQITSAHPISVGVEYGCRREGPCTVSVEVPFHPVNAPYRPVEWQWTKMCGQTPSGIYVEAGQPGMGPVLAANWHASGLISGHSLWVGKHLERSSDEPIHLKAAQIRCLDSLRCSAWFTSKPPLWISGQRPEEMHVEYSCMSSGSSLVQLNLQTDGHAAVSVTWSKDCSIFSESLSGIMIMSFVACSVMLVAVLGCNPLCRSQDNKQRLSQRFGEGVIQFLVGDTEANEFAELGMAHERLSRHEQPAVLHRSQEGVGRVKRTLEPNRAVGRELAVDAVKEAAPSVFSNMVNPAKLGNCLPCRLIGQVSFPFLENHRDLVLQTCHYLCWTAIILSTIAYVGAYSYEDLLSYIPWVTIHNPLGDAHAGAAWLCWDLPAKEHAVPTAALASSAQSAPAPSSPTYVVPKILESDTEWHCETWQDFECKEHGGDVCSICRHVSMGVGLAVLISISAFYTFRQRNDKRLHGQDSNWDKFLVVFAAFVGGTNFMITVLTYWKSCVVISEDVPDTEASAGPGLICITLAAGLKIFIGFLNLGLPVQINELSPTVNSRGSNESGS